MRLVIVIHLHHGLEEPKHLMMLAGMRLRELADMEHMLGRRRAHEPFEKLRKVIAITKISNDLSLPARACPVCLGKRRMERTTDKPTRRCFPPPRLATLRHSRHANLSM